MTQTSHFHGQKTLKLVRWSAVGENVQGQPIGLCTRLGSSDCHRLPTAARGIRNLKKFKLHFFEKKHLAVNWAS